MPVRDIAFVSQRNRPCAAYGCGVASALMLMKSAALSPLPSYQQLIRELWLHAAGPDGKPVHAVLPSDVSRCFLRHGIAIAALRRGEARPLMHVLRWLKNGPVMALLRDTEWGGDEHWVVLTAEENGMFVYLDPWYRPTQRFRRRMSRARFRALWRGAAFGVSRATGHRYRS